MLDSFIKSNVSLESILLDTTAASCNNIDMINKKYSDNRQNQIPLHVADNFINNFFQPIIDKKMQYIYLQILYTH